MNKTPDLKNLVTKTTKSALNWSEIEIEMQNDIDFAHHKIKKLDDRIIALEKLTIENPSKEKESRCQRCGNKGAVLTNGLCMSCDRVFSDERDSGTKSTLTENKASKYCNCDYKTRQLELKGWRMREKICPLCSKEVDSSPNSRLLTSAYEDALLKITEGQLEELKKLHFDNPLRKLEELYAGVKAAIVDVNYGIKFCVCGRRIFHTDNQCLLCEYKKPEGNPFKVGETVNIFGANFVRGNYVADIIKGIIESINGYILHVRANNAVVACHYKQCERV